MTAAASSAPASASSGWVTSNAECMLRTGTLNDSVAALPAAMSSSASVDVLPGMALTWTGMPSSLATSMARSVRARLPAAPRWITGPAPSLTSPPSFLASMPGSSLAKSTSTTMITSGCQRMAMALAPMKVVSSCTVSSAVRSAAAGAAA